MKNFGAIPFAARGTVIGCSSENLDVVDVLFDEPFPSGTNLGGRCSLMRGASVPVKYLLNVSTVCAPAISNAVLKLEKPTSMSASQFAAAHDSVVLATDVPVVIKGAQGKVMAKPQVQVTSKPVFAPSTSVKSSSSPRISSIAALAPPPSVLASIPQVKFSLTGSGKSTSSALSSDLKTILTSGSKKSAVAAGVTAENPANLSAKSSVTSVKGSARAAPDLLAILKSGSKTSLGSASATADTAPLPSSDPRTILTSGSKKSAVATGVTAENQANVSTKSAISSVKGSARAAPDLLAILKSGSKTSLGSASATADTASLPSSDLATAPHHSNVPTSNLPYSDANFGQTQAPPQFPMGYGAVMGMMHPMYMSMMPPMQYPQPGPHVSSASIAPSASIPVASSKVIF
jgi:hypothetical protein